MNGGYFVNASRGAVIVDDDLIHAMELGLIKSSTLDVINNESPHGVKGHPLVNYSKTNPRLIITPHIGGSSYEYLDKIYQIYVIHTLPEVNYTYFSTQYRYVKLIHLRYYII